MDYEFWSRTVCHCKYKHNRKLLSKRKKLENGMGINDGNLKTEYDFPKATELELREIKAKMKYENKNRRIRQWTLLGFILIIIISLIYYA